MRTASWSEAGFGRLEDEIAAAMAPLIDPQNLRPKRTLPEQIRRQRNKIARGVAKQVLLGWIPSHQRHAAAIVEEYDEMWGEGYDRYRLQPILRPKPWIWHGQPLWGSSIAATRFRQVILSRVIERLAPRRVLEVGCGNGINLILLACRFPQIAFTGLELTPGGHAAATSFQRDTARLPEPMQAFAPLPLRDLAAFRRIRFVQGSAAEMPFDDGAFDLTFTVLALEQMERVRARALREIARVTTGHALMIEPFGELNNRGWLLLNRFRRDYFRGRIDELKDYGLEPELAVADYPQECFLRTCLVLARKRVGS